jgi:hypothetical protein
MPDMISRRGAKSIGASPCFFLPGKDSLIRVLHGGAFSSLKHESSRREQVSVLIFDFITKHLAFGIGQTVVVEIHGIFTVTCWREIESDVGRHAVLEKIIHIEFDARHPRIDELLSGSGVVIKNCVADVKASAIILFGLEGEVFSIRIGTAGNRLFARGQGQDGQKDGSSSKVFHGEKECFN